ncbi:MAG TPA: HepT-like ribonuclease domain-containing protein [Thermoanaerobaculia bacterium]|jgi:uncharacterized protein with HEPN domain|nr:HepT-like ribonuclease domain-containing protein [Thermoanaerobaculia bacterium]
MTKTSEAKYVADMLEYARKAVAMSEGVTVETFNEDEKLQLALAHLVQIIGEAAGRTGEATRAALSSVAWSQIIGMRHRLVHDYGNINYDVVWDTATNDLPPLIAALEKFTPPEPPSA